MNTPKEIAGDALAKAVSEIIDYDDGCSYIYGRADYKVPTALRAYEAARRESSQEVTLADVLDVLVKGDGEEQYAAEILLKAESKLKAERAAKAQSEKGGVS